MCGNIERQGCSSASQLDHLASTQKEADTKLLFPATGVSARNPSAVGIFSPDTDVLVLAVLWSCTYESLEGTFRLQTSDFRLQTSDFKLQSSDFRVQTSEFRL